MGRRPSDYSQAQKEMWIFAHWGKTQPPKAWRFPIDSRKIQNRFGIDHGGADTADWLGIRAGLFLANELAQTFDQ